MATRFANESTPGIPVQEKAGRIKFGRVQTTQAPVEGYTTIAAAGSTTADATVVPGYAVVKVTGADGTKGVRLPSLETGSRITIVNSAGSALKIYPPTGGSVNGGTTDAVHTVTNPGGVTKTATTFVYISATAVYYGA